MTANLGCGLGSTLALSVMTAPLRKHMQQLCRYMNEFYIYLLRQQTIFSFNSLTLYK